MSKKLKIFKPKLRFPEFREEIEWNRKKLDEIVINFIVPMRDKPKDLSGEIPWCRIEDFDGMYLSLSKTNQGVTDQTIKEMNLKVYPIGTLLVSCSAYLGRCAITSKRLITNQTFIGLVPNVNLLDTVFFYYIMINAEKKLNALSSGTTIAYLSREKFEKFEVIVPQIVEQQKIAFCLSSLDDLITAETQKLELYKEHKKGLMQRVFPVAGELIPKRRFHKDSTSNPWKKIKLGDYILLQSGFAFQSEYFSDHGMKLVTPKNFTKEGKGNFTFQNSKFTLEEPDSKYRCKAGDLLLLLTDLTPSCELLGLPLMLEERDEEVLLNQRIVKVIVNESLDAGFLKQFFLTDEYHTNIKNSATGSTVRHSSNSTILAIELLIPNKIEQQKIASCLASLDDLISMQKEKVELLKLHKKGLMQQLFPS